MTPFSFFFAAPDISLTIKFCFFVDAASLLLLPLPRRLSMLFLYAAFASMLLRLLLFFFSADIATR